MNWVPWQQWPQPVPQDAVELECPSEMSWTEVRNQVFVSLHRSLDLSCLEGGRIPLCKPASWQRAAPGERLICELQWTSTPCNCDHECLHLEEEDLGSKLSKFMSPAMYLWLLLLRLKKLLSHTACCNDAQSPIGGDRYVKTKTNKSQQLKNGVHANRRMCGRHRSKGKVEYHLIQQYYS